MNYFLHLMRLFEAVESICFHDVSKTEIDHQQVQGGCGGEGL